MENLAQTLLLLLMASDLEHTLLLGLETLRMFFLPQNACLLLWDKEMERYIVGETWVNGEDDSAEVRREALKWGQLAQNRHLLNALLLEEGFFYQPLMAFDQHVGAIVCKGVPHIPTQPGYQDYVSVLGRALFNITQLENIARERAAAVANHERLEHLLKALDQQQRTIDQLLSAERQLSATLEAKVEERTAELRLAYKRLIQSEKLAVIGQLAGSLAHEINNPLQAIQSGLGLVMDDLDENNPNRQDLRVILDEIEHIEVLFRQMLDFYRPTFYERLPLDLNAICQSSQLLMHKKLQEHNAVLTLELSPKLPLVCADRNQIKQVLLNLLLNAAEVMPSTGGEIHLKTYATGACVYLDVIDNGSGIAIEHQAHIFEPLFTTKTRGLGLGLAISREIIEKHQGTLMMESQPGYGTTFTIVLPAEKECDEPNFSG